MPLVSFYTPWRGIERNQLYKIGQNAYISSVLAKNFKKRCKGCHHNSFWCITKLPHEDFWTTKLGFYALSGLITVVGFQKAEKLIECLASVIYYNKTRKENADCAIPTFYYKANNMFILNFKSALRLKYYLQNPCTAKKKSFLHIGIKRLNF